MPRKPKQETALVLRTCNADMTAYRGFQWPNEVGAVVTAPDWAANDECGQGLHGWLFGQGDYSSSNSATKSDAKWLVVEVVLADVIALGGKVKFPSCTIKHIGDKLSATSYLRANEPRALSVAVIGANVEAGNHALAETGAFGTATAGNWGTATAGESGTATAGNWGTLCIKRWDGQRYRTEIAYVGENGIEANTAYKLDENGKFVKA